MAQLDAPSDWRPGGRGFNPRQDRQHSFVEIDREIFSTVILSLPLIQEGQLLVSGERMCTILVNRLEDSACPVNMWLGKLTVLDMTPLGWLGRKTSTQTKPKLLKWFGSTEQNGTRAKNKKKGVDCHASVNNLLKRHLLLNRLMDFEIILQECSLSDPLPKLQKWFCSAEQNGHQSSK